MVRGHAALLLAMSAAPTAARSLGAPPRIAYPDFDAAAVAAGAALAQPAAKSAVAEFEAPVTLNERLIGEIGVRVDASGAGEVDAARFLELVAPLLARELAATLRAQLAGRQRVAIAALNIGSLRAAFDPARLELQIAVPLDALSLQRLSLGGRDEPNPSNYDRQASVAGGIAFALDQRFVESGPERGRAPLLLTTDGFVTIGAFPGLTLRGGGVFTESANGGFDFVRSPTRLNYDWFDRAIRLAAGEFTPTAVGFQGAGPRLGIGVARNYADIRPFENIRPSGRGFVTLDRASTVIVDANGVETRRLRVEAGRYQLTDLTAEFGANNVRLLVEDALGRRELSSASYFTATSILAGGLTDFGLHIGKQQRELGSYGGPLTVSGYVRRGIGDVVTLGLGGQVADGDWQVTGETVLGVPIGLFRLQAAASEVAGRGGYALSLDYIQSFRWLNGTWNLTLLASGYSPRFASPFDRQGRLNDTIWRIDGRIDYRQPNFGLGLTASIGRARQQDQRDGFEATGFVTRGRFVFTGSVGVERQGGAAPWRPRVLLGISLLLGRRDTFSAQADSQRGQVVAEYNRTPIDEIGDLSGRLQLRRNDDLAGVAGDLRYFGNRFVATLQQTNLFASGRAVAEQQEFRVRLSSFLGFADGKLAIGRPPFGGFAIYDRHPTLGGAAVTVRDDNGLIVGRQDWLGAPLVPFNRVYSPIEHRYDVDPLPLGYDLGEGRLHALPGAASGYRVHVGSDDSRVALGFLIAASGPLANLAGEARRLGDERLVRPFFTNAAGRFAIDRLAPGTYLLMVGDTEVARIIVPAKSQGLVDVGRIDAKMP